MTNMEAAAVLEAMRRGKCVDRLCELVGSDGKG